MKFFELEHKQHGLDIATRCRILGISVFKLNITPDYKTIKILFLKLKINNKNPELGLIEKACGNLAQKTSKTSHNKIAVFTGGELAISEYTVKTHAPEKNLFDVISDVETIEQLKNISNLTSGQIIPYVIYKKHKNKYNHFAKIFVLGNSEHHKASMEEAVKTKGEKNRFLYLHEAQMYGPVTTFLNGNENYIKLISKLNNNNMYNLRQLIQLTGIKHILVNNERAKELILSDLDDKQKKDLKIDIMFLPIEDLSGIKKIKIKQNDEYIVGSFGIPQDKKDTHKIIDAVYMLNSRGNNIKLLLAGYNVNDYIINFDQCKKDIMLIYNKPTNEEIRSLMKSVDLAIQLRPNSHGESSACICELLGMGQKTIATEGFMGEIVKEYCTFVKPDINTEELATIILEKLHEKSNKDYSVLIENYSTKKLAQKVYEKVKENIV